MTPSRPASPRIPYDEAICLARIDGSGRLYGRGLDLGETGLSLLSAEPCPLGSEVQCNLLLPHGPRSVSGRIAGVTPTAGGFELAVEFVALSPAAAAVIARLVERGARAAAGVVRTIAVDPATGDGVARSQTRRYGSPPPARSPARARKQVPSSLPPPCAAALPSVVVSAALAPDRPALDARPPRRRVNGTAEVARHPDPEGEPFQPTTATAIHPAATATQRVTPLRAGWWTPVAWGIVPLAVFVAAALLHLGR